MTVLQSVCSHGHKLQFGDVQQAFDTGDLIKREQPLFVRMPPDGVPGVSHEVWVQLLKTVNGLADGTREWTVRGLGCETSVSEPCVSVLRGSQRRYHGIIGVAVDDIAGGGDEVWEQAISKLKKRCTFWHWEVGKGVCPYQESDFVPLGKNESGTIGCHEISARSSWVSSA